MRLLGALCLLLCCTFTGCTAAAQMRTEAEMIRSVRVMLNSVCNLLCTSLPPVTELLKTLAGQANLRQLAFLQQAAENRDSFPQSWEDALCADRTLSAPLRQQLSEIGRILGAMPLSEQLSALALCDEQLRAMQAAAEEKSRLSGSLLQRLGVLIGLFLAILVI